MNYIGRLSEYTLWSYFWCFSQLSFSFFSLENMVCFEGENGSKQSLGKNKQKSLRLCKHSLFLNFITHLAWADFKIKVKQIAHSTLRFDQWNPLISKMQSLKIFTGLFLYSDQHAFWNFIQNRSDENSIVKSHKN